LMQPTIPAISNDLAADHTRGRYNAINAAAFQGGAIAGPVVAGLLLDHGLAQVYVGLMVVGCVGICAMARALERRIPAEVNGVVSTEEPLTMTPDRT
jgi:MFS family permease